MRSFLAADILTTVFYTVEETQDPLVHDATLIEVIGRVPSLSQASDLHAALLPGGLSNSNYLVTADATRFVVRIATGDASVLGIDRWREGVALLTAAAAGIAPEPVEFLLPEGHLVTRYLNEAHPLTVEEFASEALIPRVARRLRDIHQLDPIDGAFNPYDDIRRWRDIVVAADTTRPDRLASLIDQVAGTESARAGAYTPVLCHNDPDHRNFLDDGNLWVLDWEYAGMGDPMYDLGGAAYPLNPAGRDLLIRTYFGAVDERIRQDLDRLIGVYLCWNVLWRLVQVEASPIGHDYLASAEGLLDLVPATG